MQKISFEQLPQAIAELSIQLCDIHSLIKNIVLANPQQAKDKWLNIHELSDYLPDHPAVATIYEHTANNKIPFHKKSKRLYFLQSEIDEWLRKGRKATKAEQMEKLKREAEEHLNSLKKK